MRQDVFMAHPLWASLTQLQDAIDKADGRVEPTASEPLSSIRFLASALKSHQDPPDPAPYSKAAFDAINASLPNVINEVTNYGGNGNVTHLVNAENYADQVMHQIGLLPASLLKGGAAGQANKLFKEFRDDASLAIESLRERNSKLQEALSTAQTEFEAVVTGLKSEITSLSSKIKQDEARLDQALTTNNDAFTAKQTEREEKFREFLTKQGEELEKLAATDLKTIRERRDEAEKVYDQIDALRVGTEKVAGLASADILAGKFKEYSEQQWKWGVAANILGFVTLAVGLAVIATTLSRLGFEQAISWQYTTLKLGVTLTIVAASAVAFRLGAIFLARSGTSKRLELELRAIGPFFADIEDPDALKDAKRAFVERSFGHGWNEKPVTSQANEADSSAIIKELVEVVRTIASRSS
ncbi:hypothetical protein V6K52_16250 [Knoellia sp. S7-12]|uniref:hypothetical protein n=1 Tax=Knoellia sp. S7-12 TaxID=3126698 RepID=UPI003367D963